MGRHSLSIKEVARVLGLCEKTVRRLIERKELYAVLIGGVWRIPRSVVCERFGCSPDLKCRVSGRAVCQVSTDFRG